MNSKNWIKDALVESESALGDKIRQARVDSNLSQRELAERANLSVQSLSALENDRQLPRVSTLIDIAVATEKSVPWFFDAPETPQETSPIAPEFVANAWSREFLKSRTGEEPQPEELSSLARAVFAYEKGRTDWIERAQKLFEDGAKVLEEFGLAEPQQVFHQMTSLIRPALLRSTNPTRRAVSVEFVGRENELNLLNSWWAKVTRTKKSCLALISGPAGVGKSRLAGEFSSRIQKGLILSATCSKLVDNQRNLVPQPLLPVIDTISKSLGLEADMPEPEKIERLTDSLHRLERTDQLALACSLLTLPAPPNTPAPAITARGWREIVEDMAVEALSLACSHSPLLLLIDDYQYADPASLSLFQKLLPRVRKLPIMIFLIAREFSDPELLTHKREALTLGPLGADEQLALLEQLMPEKPLKQQAAKKIAAATKGLPLNLEQAAQSAIEGLDTHPHPTHSDPLATTLIQRLQRLDSSQRMVAQILSATSERMSLDQLLDIVPLRQGELQHVLESLIGNRLIAERDGLYNFPHEEIRTLVYRNASSLARRQCHERLALSATRRGLEESSPEIAALHYEKADMHSKAVELWIAAGRRATLLGADASAVAHLSRALNLLEHHPDPDSELRARILLAPRKLATDGYASPSVKHEYQRLLELSSEVASQEKGIGLWCGFLFHMTREELPTAESLASRCLELAKALDDPDLLLESHLGLGATDFYMGRTLGRGFQSLTLGLELADQLPLQTRLSHIAQFGQDPCIAGRGYASWNRTLAGDEDGALALVSDLLQSLKTLSHPFSRACGHHFAAIVFRHLNRPAKVVEHAQEGISISLKEGFPLWLAGNLILEGWASTQLKTDSKGLNKIKEGLDLWSRSGAAIGMPFFLSLMADASLSLSDTTAAITTLDQALEISRLRGDSAYDSELLRLKARALTESGQPSTKTKNLYREALSSASASESWLFLAQALQDGQAAGIRFNKTDKRLATKAQQSTSGRTKDILSKFRS